MNSRAGRRITLKPAPALDFLAGLQPLPIEPGSFWDTFDDDVAEALCPYLGTEPGTGKHMYAWPGGGVIYSEARIPRLEAARAMKAQRILGGRK